MAHLSNKEKLDLKYFGLIASKSGVITTAMLAGIWCSSKVVGVISGVSQDTVSPLSALSIPFSGFMGAYISAGLEKIFGGDKIYEDYKISESMNEQLDMYSNLSPSLKLEQDDIVMEFLTENRTHEKFKAATLKTLSVGNKQVDISDFNKKAIADRYNDAEDFYKPAMG